MSRKFPEQEAALPILSTQFQRGCQCRRTPWCFVFGIMGGVGTWFSSCGEGLATLFCSGCQWVGRWGVVVVIVGMVTCKMPVVVVSEGCQPPVQNIV